MATHILLHRHEEAEDAEFGGDALRALTARGRLRMRRQAEHIGSLVPVLDHVFTSPLVRAVQTAELLVSLGPYDPATPIRAEHAIAHPTRLDQLLELAGSVPAPNGFVAIVGHEPTLSSLVAHVAPPGTAPLGLATGQAVLLGPPEGGHRPILGSLRGGSPI